MFFFIGGVQPKTVIVERQAKACPVCGHAVVKLKRVDHFLSLFFIPLFRVKKGIPFPVCENCNTILDSGYQGGYPGGPALGKTCRHCGQNFQDEDFDYCPYCGRRL